jgi:hypothetical protein
MRQGSTTGIGDLDTRIRANPTFACIRNNFSGDSQIRSMLHHLPTQEN